MYEINEAIAMNHPEDYRQIQFELERQELLAENHALLAAIAQRPYSLKLLRSVRQGLLMHLDYKGTRRR